LLRSSGPEVPADLIAAKEAVALGRLNESVPPTPFVVRFIDAGSINLPGAGLTPWTALEYVHGGVEGTTLEDRVTYAVHRTGYAFDATRTAHAIRCLSSGLKAIHAANVIHRNLTPGNVLCCGFGDNEIFKISDFGLARAAGLSRTFVNVAVGTVGYSAPEQGSSSMGPQADVFSLAAIVYYLLTGQHYFVGESPLEVFKLVSAKKRQSITGYPSLSPELLERPDVCAAIDAALARATALAPNERPATAPEFASTISSALTGATSGPHSNARLLTAVMSSRVPNVPATEPKWVVRIKPRDDIAMSSVAWDTDGHALALGQQGAWFYNGQTWLDAGRLLSTLPPNMTFTSRYEAGGWLVGGDSPLLSVVDAQGVSDSVTAANDRVTFSLANGRMNDFLVAIQHRADACPVVWTLAARRWLRPLELPGAARITTLQRIDDTRWIVGGRSSNGGGFAASVSPLEFQAEALPVPEVRAFIAGASVMDRSLAVLVGSNGAVLRVEGSSVVSSQVAQGQDLAAVAIDILDREWAASPGTLWCRDSSQGESWRRAWTDPSWRTPFISIMADTGMVVAMTADGGIVEGRSRDGKNHAP
jgi:hypothetical protein